MTSMEFAAAIGEIDEKLAYMHDSSNEKRRAVPLWRYAAAAAAILLVLGAVFAAVKLLPAKSPRQEAAAPKDAVLPPAREGKESVAHSRTALFSLESAFLQADSVCTVTVGDWIGDNGTATYFKAKVDKVFKGDLPDTIELYQIGCEEVTADGFPLFTYGNRLLVFLSPFKPDDGIEAENSYELLGAGSAFFYVASAEDGSEYYIDTIGLFSNETMRLCRGLDLTNHADDLALREELVNDVASYDKLIADRIANFEKYNGAAGIQETPEYLKLHIFSAVDIERALAEYGR